MLKIETNIPIPGRGIGNGSILQTALATKVGESFVIPSEMKGGNMSTVHSYLEPAKRRGFKFAARSVDGGVRVWRTE